VRILIPAQDAQSYVRTYDVEDFLKGTFAANSSDVPALSRQELRTQIIDIIQENIDPESWRGLGGHESDIQTVGDRFVITTTDRNHKEIHNLLAQIREIHGPDASQKPPESDAQKAQREAAIAQAKREARLRRVIDQRLWPVVFNDAIAAADYREATEVAKKAEYKEAEKIVHATAGREIEELTDKIEPITLVLLVRDTKDSTIKELKSMGLNVQDVAASTKLVAGDIEPGKLADLALIESVRRIEPVQR
jgi:hypothetical protein